MLSQSSLKKRQSLSRAYLAREKSVQKICDALTRLGTTNTLEMKKQLQEKQSQAQQAVGAATGELVDISARQKESAHAEHNFHSGIVGVLSLIELNDPELFATLPVWTQEAKADPAAFLKVLVPLLKKGSQIERSFAQALTEGQSHCTNSISTYSRAVTNKEQVREGLAALAELDSLLKQAEALLLRTAKPGSSIYAPPTKRTRPRKSSSSGGSSTDEKSGGDAASNQSGQSGPPGQQARSTPQTQPDQRGQSTQQAPSTPIPMPMTPSVGPVSAPSANTRADTNSGGPEPASQATSNYAFTIFSRPEVATRVALRVSTTSLACCTTWP